MIFEKLPVELKLGLPVVFAMRARPFRLLGIRHRVQRPRNPYCPQERVHYCGDYPGVHVVQNFPYGEIEGDAVDVAVVVAFAFWAFDDRRTGRMTAKELTAERIRQNHLGPDLGLMQ